MKNKRFKFAIIAFIIIIGILTISWYNDGCVIDYSARLYGFEGMNWNGRSYSMIQGRYTEGKTIAKSEDGDWRINEVKEDPTHTFLVARSFLANYLYVADDYEIPTSGEITTVCWNGVYIDDKDFLKAMNEIDAIKTATFDYETDANFTDDQDMKDLFFAYENCPVATEYKGYMGKINDKWTITTHIPLREYDDDGFEKPCTVSCFSIPDQYVSILEKYF